MNATDSDTRLVRLLEQAKGGIRADIARGVVPVTVESFDDLTSYVDPSRYTRPVGDTVPTGTTEYRALVTEIHDLLDSWLLAGRVDHALCEVCDTNVVTSPGARLAFSDQRPEGALVCSVACRDEHYRLLLDDIGERPAPRTG